MAFPFIIISLAKVVGVYYLTMSGVMRMKMLLSTVPMMELGYTLVHTLKT